MKRLGIAVILVGLLAAACGRGGPTSLGAGPGESPGSGTGSPGTTTPPSASPTTKPSSSPSSTPSEHRNVTYQVWFFYRGSLFVTVRTRTFDPGVGRLAVNDLLAGPNTLERGAGVQTVIPAATKLRGLTIVNGVATVDLTGDFASGLDQQAVTRRLAQVVYTLTQFPTVGSVRFALDGRLVTTVGGVPVQDPQTRSVYASFLPPILVERPLIGQRVPSPVHVAGTANVFEATVSIRILDANGREIAHAFTQAMCGTGCRGTYSTFVSYSVLHEQAGVVEVFETSAKDGSRIHVVDIPVVLTP